MTVAVTAGEIPPNNWESWFGGPAWTRVTEADGSPGQWYLHLFDTSQPDFDWTNPDVHEEMESVLRFWLDREVDGFRIDVAHGLVKAEGLPDADLPYDQARDATSSQPMWDQPGVHEIYRSWRRLVDSYAVRGEDRDRLLCAEAWVEPPEALARYVRQRRAAPVVQLPLPDDTVERRGASPSPCPSRWSRPSLSALLRPGSFRITTSCATPRDWADATRPSGSTPTASVPTTSSPTRTWACAVPARRPP